MRSGHGAQFFSLPSKTHSGKITAGKATSGEAGVATSRSAPILYGGRIVPKLRDISRPGRYVFDSVVYAAAGLNYGAVPQLVQYTLFDHPDPAYVTGRIDISAFANLSGGVPWPFPNTAVPLNGILRMPRGRGPFPLAVFAHGNHNPFENSTPGYL